MARHAQQDGGVAVVAAAMKAVGPHGLVGQAGLFLHGQGVHVGAQPEVAAGALRAVDDADHAGAADAGMGFYAPFAQAFRDEGRRLVFLEAEFRVAVERAPPGGHVLGVRVRDLDFHCVPIG